VTFATAVSNGTFSLVLNPYMNRLLLSGGNIGWAVR
jgi:hypothetical protein